MVRLHELDDHYADSDQHARCSFCQRGFSDREELFAVSGVSSASMLVQLKMPSIYGKVIRMYSAQSAMNRSYLKNRSNFIIIKRSLSTRVVEYVTSGSKIIRSSVR